MLDMTTAMAILIGVCCVCLIGLFFIFKHYRKVRNQESKLTELGIIVPIENDEELPPAEKEQVD